MKNIILFVLFVFAISSFSCNSIFHETISGNGTIKTDERNVSDVSKIRSTGNFDVEISQGDASSVKVEADENLLPYIITQDRDGYLVIKTKDDVNLSSMSKIKVYITIPKLEEIEVDGSGNITGAGIFSGADRLKLDINGTGDITIAVNAPAIDASIAGTGNINISGETKNSKIEIAGIGNYKAESLKSENVEVTIAGSGDAKVFASNNLDIEIAGTGDVYYHGTPTIHQSIAGTGSIKQLP